MCQSHLDHRFLLRESQARVVELHGVGTATEKNLSGIATAFRSLISVFTILRSGNWVRKRRNG